MAAAVQEFLELPTVTGLQELKKTDLLEVAKSLNLVKVNASYRKAQIAKLIAQDLYDESLFTSEDLAPFVDVDGDPEPEPSSETELKIRLIQLENKRQKEERQFELEKLRLEGDREDSERERHERMEKERMLIEPARIGLEREKIEKQHVLILKWKINTRNTSMTLCLPLLPF